MNSVLLVDDEELARSVCKRYLAEIDPNITIFEAKNAAEARAIFSTEKIGLIVLDIEMPAQSGIEFLAETAVDCPVIFATAYNEFAVEAFELNAVDYLLKPFDLKRFTAAFNKAKQLEQHQVLDVLESLDKKLSGKGFKERIFVRDKQKIQIIRAADILAIESAGDYSTIVTNDQRIMDTTPLGRFEETLDPSRFVRIHRSTLIQLDAIEEIDMISSHKASLCLMNGNRYDVSDSGLKRLKNLA